MDAPSHTNEEHDKRSRPKNDNEDQSNERVLKRQKADDNQPQSQAPAQQSVDPGTNPTQINLLQRSISLVEPSMPNDVASTRVHAAVSEDKGCRQTMEDVWVIELDGRQDKEACSTRVCFLGVFDGHGGSNCAAYAAQHLPAAVMKAGLQQAVMRVSQGHKLDVKAAKQAISQGFKATDDELLKECAAKSWVDGACTVAVWVVRDTVLVANVGDAKCALARVSDKEGSKGQLKALTITKEHLSIYPAERSRIEKSGGFVSKEGRLNGRIQVSRSFGDAQFKKSGCSALPDVMAFELTERDHFMICACDGFWGVFDAQGAVDLAASLLAEGRDAKAVTNRLLNEAIRERKCKDNCTIMLIHFSRKE